MEQTAEDIYYIYSSMKVKSERLLGDSVESTLLMKLSFSMSSSVASIHQQGNNSRRASRACCALVSS